MFGAGMTALHPEQHLWKDTLLDRTPVGRLKISENLSESLAVFVVTISFSDHLRPALVSSGRRRPDQFLLNCCRSAIDYGRTKKQHFHVG